MASKESSIANCHFERIKTAAYRAPNNSSRWSQGDIWHIRKRDISDAIHAITFGELQLDSRAWFKGFVTRIFPGEYPGTPVKPSLAHFAHFRLDPVVPRSAEYGTFPRDLRCARATSPVCHCAPPKVSGVLVCTDYFPPLWFKFVNLHFTVKMRRGLACLLLTKID